MITEAMVNLVFEDCRKSCTNIDIFSALQGQSILVTGGTGFMGKWIAEMISYINATRSYNIQLCLLGRDIQRFKDEVPHLAEKEFIALIEQDVRNIHDLPENINYIIHAAGSPDNREHASQPLRMIETFYKGTQAVLDASTRLSDLKNIVHISSHQVYGENDSQLLINEEYLGRLKSDSINHTYAEAKRITETLCSVYRSHFKLPIILMRPFAFIGPYQDLEKPWAINNFIRDGILGESIRILGNGQTTRSYLYASDMAFWILTALISGKTGESYNLGSKNSITLEDLANKVRSSLNNNIEIITKSSKSIYTNFTRLVPDTSKIVKAFNVDETHSLDDSIKRTIVWNQLNRSKF
ncbi:MAG TPA: NAD-dependent epimerase/dehydratase family protein [Sphingobacteriaceae bacterium]|nr:NAD-dependent epimerase/dehydratase family protein [Sphingobacteriaceae bacterium]